MLIARPKMDAASPNGRCVAATVVDDPLRERRVALSDSVSSGRTPGEISTLLCKTFDPGDELRQRGYLVDPDNVND